MMTQDPTSSVAKSRRPLNCPLVISDFSPGPCLTLAQAQFPQGLFFLHHVLPPFYEYDSLNLDSGHQHSLQRTTRVSTFLYFISHVCTHSSRSLSTHLRPGCHTGLPPDLHCSVYWPSATCSYLN